MAVLTRPKTRDGLSQSEFDNGKGDWWMILHLRWCWERICLWKIGNQQSSLNAWTWMVQSIEVIRLPIVVTHGLVLPPNVDNICKKCNQVLFLPRQPNQEKDCAPWCSFDVPDDQDRYLKQIPPIDADHGSDGTDNLSGKYGVFPNNFWSRWEHM